MTTVKQLIEEALLLSICDERLSPPSGQQHKRSLSILNTMLQDRRDLIPYPVMESFTNYDDIQSGLDFYEILFLTYKLGTTHYHPKQLTASEFNNKVYLDNLRSIPTYFWFDELNKGVKLFPEPTDNYTIELTGYKNVSTLNESDNVPTSLPSFSLRYLELELARRICLAFNQSEKFTPEKKDELMQAENRLLDLSLIHI